LFVESLCFCYLFLGFSTRWLQWIWCFGWEWRKSWSR